MLKRERGLDADAIAQLANGAGHSPPPLDRCRARGARARLRRRRAAARRRRLSGMARPVFRPRVRRANARRRARRSASRAPLDLRVNTLKADRDAAAAALADLAPEPTRWSPHGLRIRLKADAKSPAVHAEPAFLKGQIEVQDEGSQLAALFAARQARRAGARPLRRRRRQDAGAGGRDGEQGPALRHRRRQAPPGADPRPAGALRRAQCPGAHAEVGRHRDRRPQGPHGSRADRRALHRHRGMAAQPGRQMAGAAGRAGTAREGAGANCSTAPWRW